MKKWHMESIINITDSAHSKLAMPNSPQVHSWTTVSSQKARKEFPLIPIIRRIVAFFVRFL